MNLGAFAVITSLRQREVIGQEAADERTDDEGDPEDGSEEALVLAAFGRCVEVGHDRECDREDGAGPEATRILSHFTGGCHHQPRSSVRPLARENKRRSGASRGVTCGPALGCCQG